MNTRFLPAGGEKYIRSDCPDRLTDDEVGWLRERGITTIVDLREDGEAEKRPCRLETEPGFSYHRIPVTGGGGTPRSPEAVAGVYVNMLDETMDKIVNIIMEAPGGTLFFCTAGKDRTGVVSAVILKRLGAGDDVIIDDYMRSGDNLREMLVGYVREHPEVGLWTILPREENIRAVLARL